MSYASSLEADANDLPVNQLYNEAITFDHCLDLTNERLLSETEDWVKLMLRRRYPCVVAMSSSGQVVGYCALAVSF